VHLGPRDKFDPGLFEQLTTRRLEWDAKGRLRIESKDDMRARGIKSPDRADAYVGALMCGARMTGAMSSRDVMPVAKNDFHGGFVSGF
ncbi:hypothetical protein ACI3PL_23600, partial [Lacticaseibacillus paracasei]